MSPVQVDWKCPHLFEPSKKGEEREKITILKASSSDLVIFVLDQDINKYELYLIKELLKIEKKIITLNKIIFIKEKREILNKLIKS